MREIIFVTPNLANGGAERVTAVLASEFAERGCRVILAYMKDSRKIYKTSGKLEEVYLFPEHKTKLLRFAGKLLGLRRLLKAHPGAAVAAMLPYETLYTFLACLSLRRRAVYSLRNDPGHMKTKLDWLIKTVIYPGAKAVVFQTEEARSCFRAAVWKKGIVIPNPLGPLPEPSGNARKKEIAAVGRLTPQKNYPLLLAAFAKIHAKYPKWRLKIFGEGELKEPLKRLCARLSLESSVEFCGVVPDVAERIRDSGMFVMTSDYEGISNAMLEALALGLPCICTDCPPGGARAFIRDGENGILIPVGDEGALEAAMTRLIEEPGLAKRFSREAVKVRQKLEAKAIAERWERVL